MALSSSAINHYRNVLASAPEEERNDLLESIKQAHSPEANRSNLLDLDQLRSFTEQRKYDALPDSRGPIGSVVSNLARGTMDLVEMTGRGIEVLDREPEIVDTNKGTLDKIGSGMANWATNQLKNRKFLQPTKTETNGSQGFIKRGILGGVRSMPLTAGVAAGAAVGAGLGTLTGPAAPVAVPVLGLLGAGAGLLGLFGLGSYGKSYSDTYKEIETTFPDMPEEERRAKAHRVALTDALFETGTEAGADLAAYLTFGGSEVFTAPLKATLKNMSKRGLKFYGKAFLKDVPFEVGSEMVAGGGEAYVRRKEGLKGGDVSSGILESVIPAVTMSLFFGAGAYGLHEVQARGLMAKLNSEDIGARKAAVKEMANRIASNTGDKSLASTWYHGAIDTVNKGEKFDLDENLIDFASTKMAEDIAIEAASSRTETPPGRVYTDPMASQPPDRSVPPDMSGFSGRTYQEPVASRPPDRSVAPNMDFGPRPQINPQTELPANELSQYQEELKRRIQNLSGIKKPNEAQASNLKKYQDELSGIEKLPAKKTLAVGDRVKWTGKGGVEMSGSIEKLGKSSHTVKTDDGKVFTQNIKKLSLVGATPAALTETTSQPEAGSSSLAPVGEVGTIENVNELANEAATSPENNLPEPTEKQIEAGNYQKGHIKVQGLDITIENPNGSTRSGTDQDGKEWKTKMSGHYGYFRRSEGKDGDQVDVFVGMSPKESDKAYIIDQVDPKTGKFDEHKVVMGVGSKEEAEALYRSNYEKGWQGLGAITEVDIDRLKDWLKEGKQSEPFIEWVRNDQANKIGIRGVVGERAPETGGTLQDQGGSGNKTTAGGVLQTQTGKDQGEKEVGASKSTETGDRAKAQAETGAEANRRKGGGFAGKEQRSGEDRRQDTERRKAVAEMTPEEMRNELLTDYLTGLGNKRAYNEAKKKAVQISIDADSLKWVNDNLGHEAGDELLRVIGSALQSSGIEAYHPSGDEFWAQADTDAEAESAMDSVNKYLLNNHITTSQPDGRVIQFNGGVSYGTGKTLNEADRNLIGSKEEREKAGLRAARGERPPGILEVGAEGNEADNQQEGGGGQGINKNTGPKKPAYGERNTVFTKDAADKARELLRVKLNQINAGLDPGMVQAGIQLAGYHIEAGARAFADFSKAMIADIGEVVRPYLRGWYEAVRYYPGFSSEGMTGADEIENAAESEDYGKNYAKRIEKKYEAIRSLPDVGVEDGKLARLLTAIDDQSAKPESIKKLIRTTKDDKRSEVIEKIRSVIADATGDLIETYRYESNEEGLKLEKYLDSLLAVTENYLPADRVQNRSTKAEAESSEKTERVPDNSRVTYKQKRENKKLSQPTPSDQTQASSNQKPIAYDVNTKGMSPKASREALADSIDKAIKNAPEARPIATGEVSFGKQSTYQGKKRIDVSAEGIVQDNVASFYLEFGQDRDSRGWSLYKREYIKGDRYASTTSTVLSGRMPLSEIKRFTANYLAGKYEQSGTVTFKTTSGAEYKINNSIAALESFKDAVLKNKGIRFNVRTTATGPSVDITAIQQTFKGQTVGKSPDGSVWVRFKGGGGVRIKFVNTIKAGGDQFEVAYGRMREDGELITGKYDRGNIELQRDISDRYDVSHETYHHLERSGMLARADIDAINRAVRKDTGKTNPTEEDRAKWVETNLRDRDAQPPGFRKVLQKIADIIDAILGAFGLRTAKGVVRGMESGDIFGRPEVNAALAGAAYNKTAGRWYSELENTIQEKLPGSGSPEQIKGVVQAWAKKGQIKSEELQWSGLTDWLDQQKGKVSKQQVLDYLAENNVRIEEVVKGGGIDVTGRRENAIDEQIYREARQMHRNDPDSWDIEEAEEYLRENEMQRIEDEIDLSFEDEDSVRDTSDDTKFSQYQMEGEKENYREVLLTLPDLQTEDKISQKFPLKLLKKIKGSIEGIAYAKDMTEAETMSERFKVAGYDEIVIEKNKTYSKVDYKSSHFEEPNIVAHIRMNDRTGPNGEKILFLEEVQSDYSAEYRKQLQNIENAVTNNFKTIVKNMETLGILEEIC
jgi:GGDEF domain-containing protein